MRKASDIARPYTLSAGCFPGVATPGLIRVGLGQHRRDALSSDSARPLLKPVPAAEAIFSTDRSISGLVRAAIAAKSSSIFMSDMMRVFTPHFARGLHAVPPG